jgi:hypothetical protein
VQAVCLREAVGTEPKNRPSLMVIRLTTRSAAGYCEPDTWCKTPELLHPKRPRMGLDYP